MCDRDLKALIALFESLRKVRPEFGALDRDVAFFNGTLHGVKLAIQQLPPEPYSKAA